MDRPRITIGIPCWNQAQYLSEAIESALGQTVKARDIIVCNDGSPDETRYVAKSYSGIKYIEQVNKGLASARNTIIMNSSPDTDFMLFLDADDIMLPHCLETIERSINENPDADIIAPSFKEFGFRDTLIQLMPNPTLEDFKTGNRIGYFSAIKKEALLEVGGYSPRMIWGYEDYHLWFNMLKVGKKILTIPDILIHYRTKEQSMINDAQKHHSELMSQIYKDFHL